MNRKAYIKKRENLMNQVNSLLDSGQIEEAEQLMNEVTNLDSEYEEISRGRANFNALQEATPAINLNNLAGVNLGENALASGIGFLSEPMGLMENNETDIFSGIEYRKAFMNYVTKGTAIPEKFTNANESTHTSDVEAAIPTHLINKIVDTMKSHGMIWEQVTKTNYKGGVGIPLSNFKLKAEWVGEGQGSDKQKAAVGTVSFLYHKLRCAVSMSLEVAVTSIDAFEDNLVQNIAKAMVISLEQAIVSGDGKGKMKGIIVETPNEGQEISAKGLISDIEDAEAALPLEYEVGSVWLMTKKTFMKYACLKDSDGQLIGKTNSGGVHKRPERTLMGRDVTLCDYLPNVEAAQAGEIFGFLFNLSDYAANTNYEITISEYVDNENEDRVKKGVMLVDGKVVDKGSLVTLKKA